MPASNLSQFWATKPADQVKYTTLEFYNAEAGLRRFVSDQTENQSFTLESGAPRNAGESVEFEAFSFAAPEPEQGEDGEVTLSIQLGAVGIDAKPYLKACFSAWPPTLEVIWREHLSGVTNPENWLYFEAEVADYQDVSVAITARQINQAARDISRKYKSDEFPGLAQNI